MSQHNTSFTRSYEASIQSAIHAIDRGKYRSVRRAAEAYNVSRTTLQARLHGRQTSGDSAVNKRILTPNEEQVLLERILEQDTLGFSPTHAQITHMASTILTARTGQSVGKRWSINFVRRTLQLRTRMSRRLDYQRGKMEDPVAISAWFSLLSNMINAHGILPSDIYNFDETGFRMGQSQNSIVVTASERAARPKALAATGTAWVTVIACINAQGWTLPPYIIFKAKEYNQAWAHGLPAGWRVGVSPKGWTSFDHGADWIKHFDEHTVNKTVDTKRLLILDGHNSHLEDRFQTYCHDHNIVPICMPAHASHLLQPLDVGCFGPLKKAYSKQMQNLISCGYHNITKDDFLPEFKEAFVRAFKPVNIQGAFRGSGVIPLDAEAVLSKLTLKVRTPSPPTDLAAVTWQNKTPHNQQEASHQVAYTIQKILDRISSSPESVIEALNRSHRGHQRTATELELMRAELHSVKTEISKLNRRRAIKQQRFKSARPSLSQAEFEQSRQPEVVEAVEEASEPVVPPLTYPSGRAMPQCGHCKTPGHRSMMCPLLRQMSR